MQEPGSAPRPPSRPLSAVSTGAQRSIPRVTSARSAITSTGAVLTNLADWEAQTSTVQEPAFQRGLNAASYHSMLQRLYDAHDFVRCENLADYVIKLSSGSSEYALYIKGNLKRRQGDVSAALGLFNQASRINPRNVTNIKQVARCLFLLGRYRAALEALDQAERMDGPDWEIYHHRGMALERVGDYDGAIQAFQTAVAMNRNEWSTVELAKVLKKISKLQEAVEVLEAAVVIKAENSDALTRLAQFKNMTGQPGGFHYYGTALVHDPKNAKAALGFSAMLQKMEEPDAALVKLRIAGATAPWSSQVWSNVGVAFLQKKKLVAASACLKRAQYLNPYDWKIDYNLGLVHLQAQQYASAFHYMSGAVNLASTRPLAYLGLGLVLSQLDDGRNALMAFSKAVDQLGKSSTELEGLEDIMIYINYAAELFRRGSKEPAQSYANKASHALTGQGIISGPEHDALMELIKAFSKETS